MTNDPDTFEDEAEECIYCSGTGMWNETVEAGPEDADCEDPCPHCNGTGVGNP